MSRLVKAVGEVRHRPVLAEEVEDGGPPSRTLGVGRRPEAGERQADDRNHPEERERSENDIQRDMALAPTRCGEAGDGLCIRRGATGDDGGDDLSHRSASWPR